MKNKNKIVIKDEFGDRWFVTKKGAIWPSHWKKQCLLITAMVNKKEKRNERI